MAGELPAAAVPAPVVPATERVPRRTSVGDVLCIGGVLISLLLSAGLVPFAAYLLAHPLANLLWSGSTSALVTGGAFARVGRIPLLLVVAAGLFGVAVFDPFYWWAGKRYGDRALRRFADSPAREGRRGWVNRVEQLVDRWGTWLLVVVRFLPVPSVLVWALLGASGVALWRFILADVVGALLWIGLLVGLGWGFGQPVVSVVDGITRYALRVDIALVVVIIGYGILRNRRALAAHQP